MKEEKTKGGKNWRQGKGVEEITGGDVSVQGELC